MSILFQTLRQRLTADPARWILGLLFVGAAVVALGFVRGPTEVATTEGPATTVLPVDLVRIQCVDTFIQERTFTGIIKAARTSEIGFERTGRLTEVLVEEGETVALDQVLARLDAENLGARQRQLQAERAAAMSLLEELEAGPRRETIEAARAEVRDLQSQVELAQLIFRRSEQLLPTRGIAQEEYDRTALGLSSMRAKHEAAQLRLDELLAGTRVEKIQAQRAVVERLDASLADVNINIGESALRAPFAGMVGERFLDEGAIVSPGSPILRIVEHRHLEAWIGLPASLTQTLDQGQTISLLVQGTPHASRVKSVMPELDPTTRTRTVIFELQEARDLVPQQVARVSLPETIECDGFWLPATALTRGNRGLWSVYVMEVDEPAEGPSTTLAARRNVEVLYTEGERILVRGTLTDGDRVISAGTHRIVAGQPVTARSMQPSSQPDATKLD